MPKAKRKRSPRSDPPATVKRSSAKAERTWKKTFQSALSRYNSEERAYKVAYSSLKRSFHKVGDRWERRRGRGDSRAPQGVSGATSLTELKAMARKLDIPGRSKMNKDALASAIKKANRKATRKSRK
jgi:cation transport regulator ChaB